MQTIRMKLSELNHPEKNVRKHPPKQIAELKRSLEKFGQYRAIVVDENNVILAGNGTVVAMRELGWEEVNVYKYDNLSENDKKKLMIADNQITHMGVDDFGAIEELLKSLDGDLDVPGYDENTIKILIEDADEVINELNGYGSYQPEDLNAIEREAEAREEHGFKPVEQTYQPQPVSAPQNVMPTQNVGVAVANEEYEVQDTRRFVVCPHCGEKIFI